MIRFLTIVCVILVVLCGLQWRLLRDLKRDLANADSRALRAATMDMEGRRDEVIRVLQWIEAQRRDDPSAARFALCRQGELDLNAFGSLVFDVYLRARADGASEVQARQRLLDRFEGGAEAR